MSIAYVIQPNPAFDFDPAFQHVKSINTILPAGDISHFSEERTRREISSRLAPYTSEDFLILSGDPELIALTFFLLSARLKAVRLLKYDRMSRLYRVRTHSLQ